MSELTKQERARLAKCGADDEAFHAEFDDLLEEKLMRLDPQWMRAMRTLYQVSGLSR